MKEMLTLGKEERELLQAIAKSEGVDENEALRRALLALATKHLKDKAKAA